MGRTRRLVAPELVAVKLDADLLAQLDQEAATMDDLELHEVPGRSAAIRKLLAEALEARARRRQRLRRR